MMDSEDASDVANCVASIGFWLLVLWIVVRIVL